MSSENSNKDSNTNPQPTPAPQPSTDTNNNNYYQRKKNWISGVDNDMVLGLGVAAATTIASIAAFPMIKDMWERFVNRAPQQIAPPLPPPVQGEEVIPPTPPNGHADVVPPQPAPVEQPPVEQPAPPQPEEEPDGLFHEAELRRKQKMMGQRPRNRYDSPFGKDIGGL